MLFFWAIHPNGLTEFLPHALVVAPTAGIGIGRGAHMSHRTALAKIILLGLIVAALVGLAGPPAGAHVCAEAHLWVSGSFVPIAGDCEPLFDEWGHACPGADPRVDGTGAGFSACVPRPV